MARPEGRGEVGRQAHWALLPAWATYAVALFDWVPRRWLDRDALMLGMQAEWVAVITLPILVGIAASKAGPPFIRWALVAGTTLLVSLAISGSLGTLAVALYWVGGGLTYLGWLFEADAPQRAQLLIARWAVATVALIPTFFLVIALARLTGAEPMLLLGAFYFLLLQLLELSGAYARVVARYRALQQSR